MKKKATLPKRRSHSTLRRFPCTPLAGHVLRTDVDGAEVPEELVLLEPEDAVVGQDRLADLLAPQPRSIEGGRVSQALYGASKTLF